MTFTPNIVGLIDANNSFSNTLAANTPYTGQWTDVSKFNSISVLLFSTQQSATNGFQVQFSPDQTLLEIITTTINANVPFACNYQIQSKYYRLIYTNSGTAITTLNLQSSLKIGNSVVNVPGSFVSAKNSPTSITLTSSSIFYGTYENVTSYAQIFTNFYITGTGTGTCACTMYLSSDGLNPDDSYGPYTVELGISVQQVVQPSRKYFSIQIQNNTSNDVTLHVETRYMQISSVTQSAIIDQIYNNTTAVTTKSVLYAQTSGGYYENTSMSNNNLNVNVQEPVSAFGEMNVTNPTPIVQFSFIYNVIF